MSTNARRRFVFEGLEFYKLSNITLVIILSILYAEALGLSITPGRLTCLALPDVRLARVARYPHIDGHR